MCLEGGLNMPKTTQEPVKQFDEKDILQNEPRFIDLFTENRSEIKPMKILLRFFKGHYFRLFLAAVFFVIKASCMWVFPLVTADVIDTVMKRPDNLVFHLAIDFIIALSTLIINIPFHMLYIRNFKISVRSVEAGLRGAMIRKLQQLSITFHKQMESGRIQSKIMRDVETITDMINSLFDSGINVLLNMTIALCVVITRNITVFFMFLLCVPIAVLLRQVFSGKMRRENHRFRRDMEHTSAAVLDMEELVPVTRAHALENKEVRKLTNEVTRIAESGFKLDRVQSLFGSVSWVVLLFFQLVCLMFCSLLAFEGKITVGEITLFQSYFSSMIGYVNTLVMMMPIIARGSESIRSIGEILSAYDIEDNNRKKSVPELRGRYEFKNVCFNYDERTPVLHDLSLTVEAGETIALVGESGSGKSTIINLVIGFNKAQSGEVLIDGVDIGKLNLHSYRQHISVVPQNSILFSGTIRDNITYGQPRISDKKLQEIIKAARLEDVIAKLPDGLNTQVGEHGAMLSGGQRQRISIARALIRNPDVIIFDEATSALDSVTEREIQSAIDNLTADRTTFIVAHRLSTIKNADKIAVLRDGRCVEYGTYDELLARKGEFYNYKIMQS